MTTRSLVSVGYLSLFGSVIALGAYLWLMRHVSPARVMTHAFVNPIVAVLLGWALADEALNTRIVVACAVIVLGVVVITAGKEAPAEVEHG